MGGLTGAGFSTDATNVIMWKCSHNLKQMNSGFKQTQPARSYNISVNHRRKILWSTRGHPSRWNDKTLAHLDEFLMSLREGKILQDVTFELLSLGEGKKIIKTLYRGAWGLSDNGYHRWSCTQAPAKVNGLITEHRLSDWIESFRKDVECTFGILKGRWRVLQTGVRLESLESVDMLWLTCCALHNFLLEEDGLAAQWSDGVAVKYKSSDFLGDIGQNDPEFLNDNLPFAVGRMSEKEIRTFGSREHEQEAIAEQEASQRPLLYPEAELNELLIEEEHDDVVIDEGGAIVVNSLSYNNFRSRLVQHFDILHRQNKIKWPKKDD